MKGLTKRLNTTFALKSDDKTRQETLQSFSGMGKYIMELLKKHGDLGTYKEGLVKDTLSYIYATIVDYHQAKSVYLENEDKHWDDFLELLGYLDDIYSEVISLYELCEGDRDGVKLDTPCHLFLNKHLVSEIKVLERNPSNIWDIDKEYLAEIIDELESSKSEPQSGSEKKQGKVTLFPKYSTREE